MKKRRRIKTVLAVATAVVILVPAADVQAAAQVDGKRCFVSSSYTKFRMGSVRLRTLGLAPLQVKGVSFTFASLSTDGMYIYGRLSPGELISARHTFEQVFAAKLADLGFTPDQKAALAGYVAQQMALVKPSGAPCLVFSNSKLVVQRLRTGISGVTGLSFTVKPRIIFFGAKTTPTIDGRTYSVSGQVVKTKAKQVLVRLQVWIPTVWTDSLGTHSRVMDQTRYYTFNLKFSA